MDLEVVNGIEVLDYGTSDMHRLLGDNNIGFNAENVTVVVLSCNRGDATIKLINSIEEQCPDFEGKILIADNGSDAETIEKLKNKVQNSRIDCKICEFGENLGVAKGRNEAVKNVETEWVMFLDNDIYFIKDIFKSIQKSIAKLGCKFINLPLRSYDGDYIYSYGGHLYIDDLGDSIHIGCGSTYMQNKIEGNLNLKDCLASFLFGGASVVNKECFLECGGFDEGMFVGFEDVDFSITLFQKGYKIGCCGELGLIHDHQKAESKSDLEYEKKRFSNKRIYESAMYFQKKRGFSVWSKTTEDWLKLRAKELGIQDNEENDKKIDNKEKAKVALVIDCRGWAFDNIASNIEKYLSDEFEFKKIYMEDIPGNNIVSLMYGCRDCDVVHFLWRGFLSFLDGDNAKWYLEYYGRNYETYINSIKDDMYITAGVYDHKFLDDEFEKTKSIMEYVKRYTVSSKKLFDIYEKFDFNKEFTEITDGVDNKLFHPININRFENIKNRAINIGWVGNSKFNSEMTEDYKGIHTIIKPAIEKLKEKGYNINFVPADRNDKYIPHDEMPEYYSKIDIYVNASLNEGTPNPVLESMACGVPVISNDVGIVREVLGAKQQEYILDERSVDCLVNKIEKLLKQLDNIQELSKENIKQIEMWTWEKKCGDFRKFFRECLQDKNK